MGIAGIWLLYIFGSDKSEMDQIFRETVLPVGTVSALLVFKLIPTREGLN